MIPWLKILPRKQIAFIFLLTYCILTGAMLITVNQGQRTDYICSHGSSPDVLLFPFLLLSVILSLSVFQPLPLLYTHTHTHTHVRTRTFLILLFYNTNVSRLSVTGERQWSRFDLDVCESALTVIKGCSELLLAPGHPLMNDMKQLWDVGDRQVEEWWRTGDSSPHIRTSPGMSSAGTLRGGSHLNTHTWRHILSWLHPDTDVNAGMQAMCESVKTHIHLQTLAVWGHSVKRVCLLKNKPPAFSLHYSCAK